MKVCVQLLLPLLLHPPPTEHGMQAFIVCFVVGSTMSAVVVSQSVAAVKMRPRTVNNDGGTELQSGDVQ